MGDVKNFINAPIIDKTIHDINDGNSTALVIPKEFPENCKLKTQVNVFNQRLMATSIYLNQKLMLK